MLFCNEESMSVPLSQMASAWHILAEPSDWRIGLVNQDFLATGSVFIVPHCYNVLSEFPEEPTFDRRVIEFRTKLIQDVQLTENRLSRNRNSNSYWFLSHCRLEFIILNKNKSLSNLSRLDALEASIFIEKQGDF